MHGCTGIAEQPGSGAIIGHQRVNRSWATIFQDAQRPDVRYQVIKSTHTGDVAIHLVSEEIATGENAYAVILATNIYQKFESGWLMIEHHASMVHTGRTQQTLQ